MKKYRIGLIRVLTTDDAELLNLHGRLIEKYFPMFEVTSRCIPDQNEGIHDDETMAIGVPKVVALAKQMYEEGFDAVIISCAGDPGVEEARVAVPIPVVGAGVSTAAICMAYGNHPAALGITAEIPDGYKRVFADRCAGSTRGEGVNSTLDLMTPAGYTATENAAREQKSGGADAIALSCTGMATIGIAPTLEKALGIPVLDPVMCEGLMTYFELLRREALK
jgi:allantoin racemase